MTDERTFNECRLTLFNLSMIYATD